MADNYYTIAQTTYGATSYTTGGMGGGYQYNDWGFSANFNLRGSGGFSYASMPAIPPAPAPGPPAPPPGPPAAGVVPGIAAPPTDPAADDPDRELRAEEVRRQNEQKSGWGNWFGKIGRGFKSIFGRRPRGIPPSMRIKETDSAEVKANKQARIDALEDARKDSNSSFWGGFVMGIVKTVAITIAVAVVVTAAAAAIGFTGGLAAPLVIGLLVVGAGVAGYQTCDGLAKKDDAEKKIEDCFVKTTDVATSMEEVQKVVDTDSKAAGDTTGQGVAGLVLCVVSAAQMARGAAAARQAVKAADAAKAAKAAKDTAEAAKAAKKVADSIKAAKEAADAAKKAAEAAKDAAEALKAAKASAEAVKKAAEAAAKAETAAIKAAEEAAAATTKKAADAAREAAKAAAKQAETAAAEAAEEAAKATSHLTPQGTRTFTPDGASWWSRGYQGGQFAVSNIGGLGSSGSIATSQIVTQSGEIGFTELYDPRTALQRRRQAMGMPNRIDGTSAPPGGPGAPGAVQMSNDQLRSYETPVVYGGDYNR